MDSIPNANEEERREVSSGERPNAINAGVLMGQKKRETRPSWRAQEPQQVDFGDEETVWSCLTYLPICDQLNIL